MTIVEPGAARSRPRRRLPLVAASALLALLATALVACSQTESVVLEGKTDPGEDAFTASVASDPTDAFSETVVAQSAELTSEFEENTANGTRIAPALTPGLYGRSGGASCDSAALLAAVTADDRLATAWADAIGISVDGIPGFLGALTPALLTVDTLVTNHGYADGVAIPRLSVLQAGTAVLVDRTGLPAVRCACGNPLLPARDDVPLSSTSGSAWVGFSASSVVTVAAGTATTSFTFTDVSTGALVDRRAGSDIGELLILTAVDGAATMAPEGAVHISRDGEAWTKTLVSGSRLDDVAASDALAVAVGTDASGRGIVHTSSTGVEWGAAISVPDPLGAVGFGDGRWLAAGTGREVAVVYESADGVSWSPVGAVSPASGADSLSPTSIAYGAQTWALVATECQYRVCREALFTSTDGGATWTSIALDETVFDLSIAHDGAAWGAAGAERNPDSVFIDMASLGADSLGIGAIATDPTAWEFTPTEPSRIWLTGLSAGLGDWLALDIIPYGSSPTAAPNGIHRSADAVSWTRAGTTPEGATAVAAMQSFAELVEAAVAVPTTPIEETGPREGAFVTIGTTGVEVAAGADSAVLPYAGAAADAVAELTRYLGPGASAVLEGNQCSPAGTAATSWGSFTVFDRPDGVWFVTVDPDLPDEVDVRLPGGLTLPVTGDELLAAHAGSLEFADDAYDYAQFLLTPADGRGVQVTIHAGQIRVTAPALPDDGVGHGCIV